MLASPDMCRSFLSFLDVPDEEAIAAEVNQEPSEKPTTEVKKDIREQAGMSIPIMVNTFTVGLEDNMPCLK